MDEEAIFRNFNGLDILKARFHHRTFSKHVHEGYCIEVINSGVQRFEYNGCKETAITGRIVAINADQVHTGQTGTEYGWSYQAIYPTPGYIEDICKNVLTMARPYFPSVVINDPETASLLLEFHRSLWRQDPLLKTQSLLQVAIVQLVARHSQSTPTLINHKNQSIGVVRDYLHEYFQQEVSLDNLSQIAQLSKFHLIRQFKKYFGLTPHAYQIQLRIQHAQKMLKMGKKIAYIAAECGFHDQSHLHRHFHNSIGVTPGVYQAMGNFVQD